MSRAANRFACDKVLLISARRSVPGAQQRSRSYHSSSSGLTPFQRVIPWFAVISGGLLWYDKRHPSTLADELNESRRKHMEESGVNMEVCETKIAELKQLIESGSILDDDESQLVSYDLEKYEEWLQVFTKGA